MLPLSEAGQRYVDSYIEAAQQHIDSAIEAQRNVMGDAVANPDTDAYTPSSGDEPNSKSPMFADDWDAYLREAYGDRGVEWKPKGIPEYTIDWNNGVKATQDAILGTEIPRSFVMEGIYINGEEIWVHGNATKHMGEFVNSANGSILVENELMTSFIDTVLQILPNVGPGKNFIMLNGWEIGINGDTGVIYHALYK